MAGPPTTPRPPPGGAPPGGAPPPLGADVVRLRHAAATPAATPAVAPAVRAPGRPPAGSPVAPPAPPTWAPPPPAPRGGRRLVRPYAVTGGRTNASRAEPPLPLEALCFVTPAGRRADLHFERATVALLCGEVQSVVEIAAHSRLPLGVARVLVADMRDEGLLDVTVPVRDGRPSAALLEKVLDGLRAV